MKQSTDHAIIILAAGNSSRLGQPKQLLPYQQHTLLVHTIQEALSLENCETIVVVGAYADVIRLSLPPSVTVVFNEYWQNGIGSSIQKGITYLQQFPFIKGCLLSVCDQPFLSRTLLTEILHTQQITQSSIVASDYGVTIGVPVYFKATHFDELAQLHGSTGAKSLLEKYRESIVTVPFPEGITDIDTLSDYHQLIRVSD